MKEFIYIWIHEKKKIQKIAADDPRIDWSWPHTTIGNIKLFTTKNKGNWAYRPYGKTPQECLDSVNRFLLQNIEEKEKQLALLKSRIITLESLEQK